MAHDVFLSYSSKDKPMADAACAALENAGIRCWVAPRDILPGADWGESIIRAITASKVMVLVFSSSANTSPQIRREVERAVNKGILIIPMRIENVQPTDSLEYFISTPHWLDAFTPPMARHFDHLTQVIRQLLQLREPDAPAPVAAAVMEAETGTPPAASPAAKPIEMETGEAGAEAAPHRDPPPDAAMWQSFQARFSRRQMMWGSVAVGAALTATSAAVGLPWLGRIDEKPRTLITGLAEYRGEIALSADGKLCAFSNEGIIRVINTVSNKEHSTPKNVEGAPVFSPDGQFLAACYDDRKSDPKIIKRGVIVWDVATGTVIRTFSYADENRSRYDFLSSMGEKLAISPDSRIIASTDSKNGMVKLWEVNTGQILKSFSSYDRDIHFSPDGRTVASLERYGNVWDVSSGIWLYKNKNDVWRAAFTPDSSQVAAVLSENTIAFWNARTGVRTHQFPGGFTITSNIVFSRDGRLLIGGCWDGDLRVWNVGNGKLAQSLTGHTGVISAIAISGNGNTLGSISQDGTIRLWRMPSFF